MKKLLIETIQSLGYPIFLQGSLSKEEAYPDTFFTFWNNDSIDVEFYDNEAFSTVWDFDLNVYSNKPSLVNTLLLEAKKLLKQKGFIVNGKGYDVGSDEPTHTGRGINVLKIEK